MNMADAARTLIRDLAFGESPRWGRDGRLWLADWATREIVAVDLAKTKETVLTLPGSTFEPVCFDWLPDGRLVIVSSHDRTILQREATGSLTVYADLAPVSSHGLNEIVVDGHGRAYVNSPGFDLMSGAPFAPGIIALVTPDGSVQHVADGLAFPNGMCVTPDSSTLIVAESYGKRLTGFDIAADGTLSNRRVWADLVDGVPDGICMDADGAVWYADVPNKRCARVREGGEILQSINLDRGGFACMLGGADGRTLFVVTREWRGIQSAGDSTRTGEVRMYAAPARHAGFP
jgi:sugar lactone lactonase YvrE